MTAVPSDTLRAVAEEISRCTLCPLHETRTKTVPGLGHHAPRVMFIGEAPGKNEDEQGLPFVGRAGALLDELLGTAGLRRREVFIGNILKCRPPGNRNPQRKEIAACTPYLERQLRLLRPGSVCTLGNFAAEYVFDRVSGIDANVEDRSIGKVHGRVFHVRLLGRPVRFMPMYHPAAAIYNRKLIEVMKGDFVKLKGIL